MQYVILILAIIAAIIVAKLLAWPLKKIFKLILNILIGLLMILLVNIFGQNINLHIPFNNITALVSGILGIPGVICLIVLNYIF